MALSFNFSAVHNHERVTTDPTDPNKWHPVADALVWLSMICGFDEITEKNCDKVADRVLGFQKATSPYLCRLVNGKRVDVLVTPDDVRRFVGMTTNAPTMTDSQWLKRLGMIAMDEGGHLYRYDTPTALSIFGECTKEAA